MSDKPPSVTISLENEEEKRLVRIVAARLGYRSVSSYLAAYIHLDINRYLTPEDRESCQQDMDDTTEQLPKPETGRRRHDQVAQ